MDKSLIEKVVKRIEFENGCKAVAYTAEPGPKNDKIIIRATLDPEEPAFGDNITLNHFRQYGLLYAGSFWVMPDGNPSLTVSMVGAGFRVSFKNIEFGYFSEITKSSIRFQDIINFSRI